ncbi:MAG: cytochrome C oxidase subunit IV family protein [Acidobacteria bacterium]|nr:cytochrome C oxidase subunit IV family protein [Acidobacteriota bacterium]
MEQANEKEPKLLNGILIVLALAAVGVAAMTAGDLLKAGTDDLFLILVCLLLAVLFAVNPLLWAYRNGKIFQPLVDEPVEAHGHDEAHGGSNRENLIIWGALLALTGIEIYLGYKHLNAILMLSILIGLSLIKAGLIVAYFMHMKFERKTFIYTVIPTTIVLLCLFAILFPDGRRLRDNRGVTSAMPTEASVEK